jgi:mono/diheme cytochrome c family protein
MEASVLISLPERRCFMYKKLLLFVFIAAIGSLAYAQSKPKIKRVPAEYTSPASGPDMFRSYCSACHGVDGTGNGPAAAALKKQPANLTQLSAKNGGKFPALRVVNFIQGDDTMSMPAAHGTRDMPMWGTVFRNMGDDTAVRFRLRNLTDYIESLQKK